MEKNFSKIYLTYLIFALFLYIIFIIIYQNYAYNNALYQLDGHAKVVASSLWKYEKDEPLPYLMLAAKANNYILIDITDDTGFQFSKHIFDDKNEYLLSKLGILPLYELEKPVIYNGQVIGKIKVKWRSRAIYTYIYVFLFLVLFSLVIWFFLGLMNAKKNLEERVARRTFDLNKSREQLKINEERLDLALKGANEGIWDWNLLTNEVHFDKRYYTMSGYEPYEFPEDLEEWEKRVHPEDIDNTRNGVEKYLKKETDTFDVEFRFLKKDGDYMWIRGRGEIHSRDNDGNPLRFTGTHSDITEKMEHEKELKKLRNYLSNIIDSMPSVLIGVNTEGAITQWNRHSEKVTGISQKDAVGRSLDSVYPLLSDEMENVKKAVKRREKLQRKKRETLINGLVRYEDVTVYPLTANGIEGAVIRVDDVTDQVKIEEMMVQSEKMLSVGGLAAGMAHEINNPLAGMIQTANVMKSRLGDIFLPANIKAADEIGVPIEGIKSFMEKRGIMRMIDAINESGCRAAEIVENMLSFARKSNSAISTHNPTKLLDQILELATTDYDLKKQYDFKTIGIVKEYEEGLPMMCCEGAKIQQVFLNILRNGAQAMLENIKKGTDPKFVLRIQYEKNTDMVRIEVEDNGPGIKKEIISRIFEPFFTTKPPGLGTGLGLSVSYFIITENHKGTLDVESKEGVGTKFIIRLPVNMRKKEDL